MLSRWSVASTWGCLVVYALVAAVSGRAAPFERSRQGSSGDTGVEDVVISAERFSFTPSEITVRRGTTLRLRVHSQDTMHGFRILGTPINATVPKRGRGEVVLTFRADVVGEFEFECSKLCGAGHAFMRGAIIVRPEDSHGSPGDTAWARGSRGVR